MTTLLLQHSCFKNHLTMPGHPENPARMGAVADALSGAIFDKLVRETAPEGGTAAVAAVHPESHIDFVREAVPADPDAGPVSIDGDTCVSAGSWDAALHAVGASCRAVDAVADGEADNAFAAIRPPGHHAETAKAMGFCLFANAAVAARHAQNAHGMDRVAIMDFDVHHGNGSQEIFYNDPTVMYCSTHQAGIFPGTGHLHETGAADNIVNAPLQNGDGGAEFRAAMEERVLPALRAFEPELLIISAGFDAHALDPLANINLHDEDFAWATRMLMEVVDGQTVSLLEGGYNLKSLASSVKAHVETLLEA